MSQVETSSKIVVKEYPQYHRLRHVEVDDEALKGFFESVKDISVEQIEYIPFDRFYLSKRLLDFLGKEFQTVIRGIVHDRNTGGFTLGVQNQTDKADDYVKFGTAITHMIGIPNFDGMSGKYYARFTVEHSFNSDTYLKHAYRRLYLHTDGTFVNEKTDWLLMMKFEERNAIGGETLLLHLDDWSDLPKFRNHPLASRVYEFCIKGRASKKIDDVVYNTTFFDQNNAPCIRFNDQCSVPKTIEEAMYHREISQSLEKSEDVKAIRLPVGDLVVVNNHFWMHGRDAFERNENLFRELMRQRGYFAEG